MECLAAEMVKERGMRISSMSKLLAAGLLVVAAVGGVSVYGAFLEQINNAIMLERYAASVADERRRLGRCPSAFDQLDVWGRRVVYRCDDGGFLLVSFGRDGVPDKTSSEQRRENTCLFPNRDTMFDDSGVRQACLK